jgi:hypothetical protein
MATVRRTILICGGLLAIFAAVAWTAIQTKSPTVDEPYHAAAGWLHLWQHDFRLDTEDPPLWNMWAALPNGPRSLHSNFNDQNWSGLPYDNGAGGTWAVHLLYQTPDNDADSFIRRSRAMMLILSVLLGAAIAVWTWRLARSLSLTPAAAAITATVLFCFDPNFLAHAALIKNDVAASLAMLGLIVSVWAIGHKLTLPRLLAMTLLCGFALTVKFNGPLIVLIATAVLISRALLPYPWIIAGRPRETLISRLTAAFTALAIAAAISFGTIWLIYDLRFSPAPNPDSVMNLNQTIHYTIERTWQSHHLQGHWLPIPTTQDLAETKIPLLVTAVEFANQHHLLPQPWLAGLLFTYQSAILRDEFLCGQLSTSGWWWYFPFTIAVKTPLATLAAFSIALTVWLRYFCKHFNFDTLWSTIALALPVLIYLATAISSNLNLGVRHVFPIYPFLFATTGLASGWLWQWKPKLTRWVFPVLLLGLIVESLTAYPNFIPFFNAAAGGSRGGLRLLSDSNLDWGQDLKLLANWQQQHPQEKLYLSYFGAADPAAYGILSINITGGYPFGPPPQPIDSPGILAISATTLQGTNTPRADGQSIYKFLWNYQPIEILGGSIYLFRFPPQAQDYLPPGQHLIN